MDPERYQRVKRIFFEASRRHGPDRTAYLESACGSDTDLRGEIERLFAEDTVATGGLAPRIDEEPPAACGPYRIEREVGRGGMGVVYEATDSRSGERVAVKLLFPHAALPRRIAREVQLGARVEHAHVVRTLDAGTQDGRPFLVMEFVEGKDLRVLLRELGTVPETLLREIATQAAAGLAAIHAAGIVHRDLKPENICITDAHNVCLMDFGIAKLQETSAHLTAQGQFIGSLNYAAPEQCDMGEVGPAADLYALGVVLYELATGVNPFRHEQPGAVIRAHLDLTPPPADEANPELSAFFAAVLAALLQKDPADRFADAGELGRVLAGGETGAWWRTHGRARRRPALPVRRETRVFGRDEELAALRRAWDAAVRGDGCAVVVRGEAGLGKTRLLDTFLDTLPADACILYGACTPAGGVRGLVDAIEGRFGLGTAEQALGRHIPPALAAGLAAMARGEPRALGDDALEAAVCRLLQSLAQTRPTVWILEDVHVAPEAVRGIAGALARAAGGHRALVLATSRDVAPPGFERLDMTRLAPAAVIAMLRELHAPERVAAKSGGVPFFVLEIARSGEEDVPSAVRDLIATRLEGLERDERAVLDVGAICGERFQADLVARALGRPVVDVLQDLAEIERRLGLVRAAGRLYRFDHALVQETLYDALPQRLREEYHALLADATPEPLHEVVFHRLRGTAPEAALPDVEAALDGLEADYRRDTALDIIERALPLCDGPPRAELLLRRADLLDGLARREAQHGTAQAARDLADRLGDAALKARARIALGGFFAATSRETAALAHYTEARDLAREAADRRLEAGATSRAGRIHALLRQPADAMRLHEDCLRMARDLGDPELEANAFAALGQVLRHQARYPESLTHYKRALALVEEHGSWRIGCYHYGGIGVVLYCLGRFEDSCTALRRQIDLAAEIGERRAQSTGTGNLAITLFAMGRSAEASARLHEHFRLTLEIGNRRGNTVALWYLGETEAYFGRFDRARTYLESALERSRDVGARHLEASALDALGHLESMTGGDGAPRFDEALRLSRAVADPDREAQYLLRLGRTAEARRIAEERDLPALRLLAAAQAGDVDEARAVLGRDGDRIGPRHRMEAHWHLGDGAEARRLFDGLVALAPGECRDTMRRNVPLHRSIMEA